MKLFRTHFAHLSNMPPYTSRRSLCTEWVRSRQCRGWPHHRDLPVESRCTYRHSWLCLDQVYQLTRKPRMLIPVRRPYSVVRVTEEKLRIRRSPPPTEGCGSSPVDNRRRLLAAELAHNAVDSSLRLPVVPPLPLALSDSPPPPDEVSAGTGRVLRGGHRLWRARPACLSSYRRVQSI